MKGLPKTIKMNHRETDDIIEVDTNGFVSAMTKDLKEFGYSSLTEDEVKEQLSHILNGERDKLSIIGRFIERDNPRI